MRSNIFVFFIILQLIPLLTKLVQAEFGREWIDSVKLFYYYPTKREGVDIVFSDLLEEMDTSRPLKVLIHGWNANRDHNAIAPLRNAYLAKDTDNLILADWSQGANQLYDVSRSMVPKIGLQIGEMLKKFMEKKGIEPDNVHVIGHSLGAHIAGNVGKFFKGKLDRVTGLDPAGPLFRSFSWDAIAQNDAQFVDIIHSGIGSLGELTQRGTVDFYPNRGFNPQPGCHALDPITGFACSHYRSVHYFAESVLIPNNFMASECTEDEILNSVAACHPGKNIDGERQITYMGEDVDRNATGIFYLDTNSLPPYGKGNNLYDDYTD